MKNCCKVFKALWLKPGGKGGSLGHANAIAHASHMSDASSGGVATASS